MNFVQHFTYRDLFKFGILLINRITWALLQWKLKAIHFFEPFFAVLTVAYTIVITAVVPCLVSKHIEKYSIHRIFCYYFLDYFQGIFSLIIPVNTGMDHVIIIYNLALLGVIEPFWVFFIYAKMCLTEIKTCYKSYIVFMTLLDNLSNHITFQVWTFMMIFKFCRIECSNTARIQHQHVGR